MKRNMDPTVVVFIAFAAFVVSMVPTAQARTCSNATAAGEYGFAANGSIIFPTGPAPLVEVGRFTEDEDGNFAGSETISVGGVIAHRLVKGTFSINPDCTGTITRQTFTDSGAPLGTAIISIVVVDNGRKQLGIFTEFIDPKGALLPTVLSTVGERISFGKADIEEAVACQHATKGCDPKAETLVVSMVPTVQARTCSNATVAGEYGFAASGSVIFPTRPVPAVEVGRFTVEEDGNLTGSDTGSLGGVIAHRLVKGTLSINPDCTGAMTLQSFTPSGALLDTTTVSIVVVDNERKQLGIVTKLIDPKGAVLPTVLSIVGERISPTDKEDRCTAVLRGARELATSAHRVCGCHCRRCGTLSTQAPRASSMS